MNTTFDLIAYTQVRENYGAHDWDGKGECPQHWKCKGGNSITVAEGLSVADVDALGRDGLEALVDDADIGVDNEYWNEYVIGWDTVEVSEQAVLKAVAKLDSNFNEYYRAWIIKQDDTMIGFKSEARCYLDVCEGVSGRLAELAIDRYIELRRAGDELPKIDYAAAKVAEVNRITEQEVDELDYWLSMGVKA